jgi:chemotaxis protein methyltransferase CheR
MNAPTNFSSYKRLSALLERHTGQVLLENRHWRVEMALKSVLRQNSIPDIDTLASILYSAPDEELSLQCVEAMINNETCFFRDQANFALLTGPLLDSIRQKRESTRRIRIWSAACSTGQEPYSIAMAISENAEKWRGWDVQIVATDVSTAALSQAKSGQFTQFEIQRGLPVMMMVKYFAQEGENWIASPQLRNMIRFETQNMLVPPLHLGQFDIILCRNMLMYLGEDKRKQALDNLAKNCAPDGMLMQTHRFNASKEFRGFYEAASESAMPAIGHRSRI